MNLFARWPLMIVLVGVGFWGNLHAQTEFLSEDLLAPPAIGATRLHVLRPTMLELTLISGKSSPTDRAGRWNFVTSDGSLNLPAAADFAVTVNGRTIGVRTVGFKRRVCYAPLAKRDLRIGNYIYLELANEIRDGEQVAVSNPRGNLWERSSKFSTEAGPLRFSPAIHVNQVGYVPAFPKTAMVGYFLGSAGELDLGTNTNFQLIDGQTGAAVFQGKLKLRKDVGFNITPLPYQKVMEADFSKFNKSGEYRLQVPALGASFPFTIDDGVTAAAARTYALGLYHQRCGCSNALPFTRFTHGPCHIAAAEIPTGQFTEAAQLIARASQDYTNNNRHTAKQLKDFSTGLFPFVWHGRIDVAGGHHDAGDYSKYTINSAGLIHALVFAVDAFPGVGELDNLGLPESGDGKSDLLQEAKWEADFLAKMQDEDGGFYFLVYPRNREYENDVLPDRGDSQIVWPKNTAVTAAAVAALAQTASSPLFKTQFPEAAAGYLERARKGWAFLERALAQFGQDGAYQRLTHYGDDFMHDDELAWAAAELFAATGDAAYQSKLLASFNPDDEKTRRWGWWRLYESYGRAIRSYAFAARTGRLRPDQLNAEFLRRCEKEIAAAADDQLRWSEESAYGTSFPTETKRFRGGGWYFSMDQAFDLAVASAVERSKTNLLTQRYLAAIVANLNYELGCNPVNVSYLTGLGWKRQTETVHHYAMNDRRSLPPDGIPLGNIQSGFMWLDNYKGELGSLSYPPDGAQENPYPIYDRWGDSFNVQTEFVVVNQARALATAAFLMAQTSLKGQKWQGAAGSIEIKSAKSANASASTVATLKAGSIDLRGARILWEAEGRAPEYGTSLTVGNNDKGFGWIEAEAQLPDGRRVFAVTNSPPSSKGILKWLQSGK